MGCNYMSMPLIPGFRHISPHMMRVEQHTFFKIWFRQNCDLSASGLYCLFFISDMNPCRSNPCRRGNCVNYITHYLCECPPGSAGPGCDSCKTFSSGWGVLDSFTVSLHGRSDSRFAPSQWETSFQSNDVSHWLGANLESVLHALTTSICRNR